MTKGHVIKRLKDQIGCKLYARFVNANDVDYFDDENELDLSEMDELYVGVGDPGDIMLELTVSGVKVVAKPSKPIMVDA